MAYDAYDRMPNDHRKIAVLERFLKVFGYTHKFMTWLEASGYVDLLYEYECTYEGRSYIFFMLSTGKLFVSVDGGVAVRVPWCTDKNGELWIPKERKSFVTSVKKSLRDGAYDGIS